MRRARAAWTYPTEVDLDVKSFAQLLSHTLRDLDIRVNFDNHIPPPRDLLTVIHTHSPRIHILTLTALARISLSELSMFQTLRTLIFMQHGSSIDYIDAGAIQAAAHLEHLQDLAICLPHISPDVIQLSNTAFQTLKTLGVSHMGQHWCNIPRLLTAISSPCLTSITILFAPRYHPPHCALCGRYVFLDLLKNRWADCLQEVRVNFDHFSFERTLPGAYCVVGLRDLLDPLFALRKLRVLEVLLKGVTEAPTPELQDADAWRMADSWPDLEYLRIAPDGMEVDEFAAPSIQSWIFLALQCQRLHTLDVPAARPTSHPAGDPILFGTVLRTVKSSLQYLQIHRLMPPRSAAPAFLEVTSWLCNAFPDLILDEETEPCGSAQHCEWSRLKEAIEDQRTRARDIRDG